MLRSCCKRLLLSVLAVCLWLTAMPISLPAAAVDIAAPESGKFNLLWVTDPQIYVNSHRDIFSAQNDWILANANRLKVKYAFNTGDLVHYCNNEDQWKFVSSEYKKWDDAGFAYGVLAGNHDVNGSDHSTYSKYFGASRYNNTEKNWWYGGDYKDNFGHYDLRSTGGANFIFVYLSYGDYTEEDYAWVNSVLSEHSNRIAFLAVHDYMATNGGRSERGEALFQNVVLKNPNVRMVLCGHNYNSNRAVDEIDDNGDGKADRTVYQIMANYQYTSNGGNGFIRFMECDVAGGTITHRTYSPHTASFGSDYEDGKIYDEFGYRDSFVTPFDFSDPTPKADGDPAKGTVVYSSEFSLAPTDNKDRLTLPVVYQNQAEAGDTYRGIGVYDRFFSLDAADAFKNPTALTYVVTSYTQSSGHTIKQVINGSSLPNTSVRLPIPQNGAVIAIPSSAGVSLDELTVGRRVMLNKMLDLATPSPLYATNITVPSFGGTYNISDINRTIGNSEWVLYDSLNTSSSSHAWDMLFAFSKTGTNTYQLTACNTSLGSAKSLSVPSDGFVLAVNVAGGKATYLQSLREQFTVGLTVTLNGHTPGKTPSYKTQSLLAPSVSSYKKDSTIVVQSSGTSQVFYNTDGLYPKADYTYPSTFTVDPSSSVLYYDYMLEEGLNACVILFFQNGDSITIQSYFEGGIVSEKSGDLEGDNVRRTGKVDLSAMNIPTECFNADGTLTIQKIRIFASGQAQKKFHVHTLAVTTDRSPVGDAVIEQSLPLLGGDITVATATEKGDYVYENGVLTVNSQSDSNYEVVITLDREFDVTALKNLLMQVDADVPFDIRPVFTTSADDASYGLASDFWPDLCDSKVNGLIPAGNYDAALNVYSCFTWNNVLPANGLTTVKKVRVVLGGAGKLTLHALQVSNATTVCRFDDGVYAAASTPDMTLSSDVYNINADYIQAITERTTVAAFLSNLTADGTVTVMKDGVPVGDNDVVASGMTLTVGTQTRTLLVDGDVNGDGLATTTDARFCLMTVLTGNPAAFTDWQAIVADVDQSGIISTTDIRIMLVGFVE